MSGVISLVSMEQTEVIEETERRLNEWGLACREGSQALGLPTISGISRMIEHVRAQERLQKGVQKKALRRARKAWKQGNPPIDAKSVAVELGYADSDMTAKGKQKKTFREINIQLNSDVAQIDSVVSKLPGWMKQTVFRSYMYRQPDRRAAQDLRLPKDTYRLRRIAALEYVGDRLYVDK